MVNVDTTSTSYNPAKKATDNGLCLICKITLRGLAKSGAKIPGNPYAGVAPGQHLPHISIIEDMIMSSLSPRQMFLLDEACKPIHKAFGNCPYLVGTAAAIEKQSYRDVDVRLMLFDNEYDALKEVIGQNAIIFLSLAIGEYLASRTNMPIDFQIQRQTEANEKHKGIRNALGCRDLSVYKGDAAPKE